MTTAAVEIPAQDEWKGYALSYLEYLATVEKIEKINARAAKRGFTGHLAVEATVEERTHVDGLTGIEIAETVYLTKVTGEAPSYNGWTFLARVDRVEDTFTVAAAPGAVHVDRSLVHAGVCDHCGFNRQRNNTYLVRNDATGEVVNVGSTCIKDFLGWSATVVFFSEEDANREISGFAGTGERSYSVDTILAVAYAATRAFGFVRSGDYDGYSTASRVWDVLSPSTRRLSDKQRAELALLKAYAAEANETAATIKAFILSDDFAGQSTYVDNLKVAAGLTSVTGRQVGLLASAPQAYARHNEGVAKKAAAAARPVSEYMGTVGEKINVRGTITAIRFIEGQYGTTVLYTIVTSEGNLVKWFASREALGTTEDVQVDIQGTVKKHDEYQGIKSTVLTRCKAV